MSDPAANTYSGGGWAPLFAVSADSPSIASFAATTFTGSFNCTLHPIGSGTLPGNVTIPAFRGNLSAGGAPFWFFVYRNASGGILLTTVVSGSAQLFASLPPGGCASVFGLISALGSNVIDSPAAALTAMQSGGSSYLTAHPNASMEMLLNGGLSFFGFSSSATWQVRLSNCPLPGSPIAIPLGPQSEFNATINATSGGLMHAGTTTVSCPIPVNTVLAVGTPIVAAAGTQHWYNTSVESASDGIAAGNLSFLVKTATGAVGSLPTGALVSLLSISGSAVGTYSPVSGVWTSGAATVLQAGMTLSLDSQTANLSGDTLVISGVGTFYGTLSIQIP